VVGAWPLAPVFAERRGTSDVPVDVLAYRLEVDADAVAAAAAILSADEQWRADRYLHDRDRRRFTVSRAVLRVLLADRLGIPPAWVAFQYGAQGKPALAPDHGRPGLRFNLSHTGELAVFAFAHGHEVGVDVESIDRAVEAERLAAGFFSAQEVAALRALAPDQRRLGFLNGWTRKEAFVKALGNGLGCPLDSFDVSIAPDEPARILRFNPAHGDPASWHVESFSPASEFVAALVVDPRLA
jgi:4'-phosphopantetheinyl transferase